MYPQSARRIDYLRLCLDGESRTARSTFSSKPGGVDTLVPVVLFGAVSQQG
jgi:hypothetical protein